MRTGSGPTGSLLKSDEENNMWLEDPAITITTGIVTVMAGFFIIAAAISVLSQVL